MPEPAEIPDGTCECGCGQPTEIARYTNRARRHFRGHPLPYLHGHNKSGRARGPESPRWKGGRAITSKGYVLIHCPEHPNCGAYGYVSEHRLVMERHLGRLLGPDEVVHHVNGVKNDNRIENLEVMRHGEHSAHHAPYRVYDSEKMRAAGRKGAAARWGKGR